MMNTVRDLANEYYAVRTALESGYLDSNEAAYLMQGIAVQLANFGITIK